MPLRSYGVLKGHVINKKRGSGRSPHFQIHVIDDTTDYRISINVKSKLSPSELLYFVDEQFKHPLTEELQGFQEGFTSIASGTGGVAMDYIRGNLFDPGKIIPLAHDIPGPDNDLNEKISHFVERAMNDIDSVVYAFGERWGPEDNKKDKYFGFKPGNGIHDIHMNQGNTGSFVKDDGVWQDGGLLFYYPDRDQWVGIFLAFQSQAWHTDDETGHSVVPVPDVSGVTSDGMVRIVGAMVNPLKGDVGKETVILVNTAPETISLKGWSIADKYKKKEIISVSMLEPGEASSIILSGKGAQLSNKGGIITLLDQHGTKIDGVSYTKTQARKQGWTLVF